MLYTILIEPLVQIIEIIFMIFNRMLNAGMAVVAVSVVVSLLTHPFYMMAEKWQQIERNDRARLAPKLKKIKAVFSGDERHLITTAYYRLNHYHPLYSLRNSIGLVIQIPFFMAAYMCLSNLQVLHGQSFLFIKNLGAPDALLPLWGGINLLPVVMTLINCFSAAVYTGGQSGGAAYSQKAARAGGAVQLYLMAAVFLVLLYNSPSGLVLYWTCNNLFSLVKNIALKIRLSRKVIHLCVCAIVVSAAFYLLFVFDKGYYVKRAALAGCFLLVCFFPWFASLAKKIEKRHIPASSYLNTAQTGPLFIVSALILCILTGLAIPSALIGSSVEEFSYIAPYTAPNPFLAATALRAVGVFLLWPIVVYMLFSPRVKFYGALLLAAAGCAALIDTYAFAGNYGFLSITLTLSNDEFSQKALVVLLEIALLAAVVAGYGFLFMRKRKWLLSIQTVLLVTLCGFSIFNIGKIQRDFSRYADTVAGTDAGTGTSLEPVFTFSRTEKNVLVVMLDRALSPYLPVIFEEKPALNESFSGFTWYPNCVTLGPVTISGAPPLFGGYEYAPDIMGQNNGTPLVEKHNQALLVMPRIFSEHGYRVTVSDPAWANYSYKSDIRIYEPYPAINAVKIIGKYTKHWLAKNPDVHVFDAADFLQHNLLRFSFLRITPPFLRFFVYDGGKWLSKIGDTNRGFSLVTLDEYTSLDALPEITASDGGPGTLTVITNQLTHEPDFLQAPEYKPSEAVTDRGSGVYAHKADYHANMAAILLLSRYFDWLKDNNAYDNTRIIIVADHGWDVDIDFDGNIVLPNGERVVSYNPLLLFKDFDTRGPLATDRAFMTNADTPFLAVDGLIPDARNPWTGTPIQPDKANGVTITTSTLWSPDLHTKYAFKISDDEYLRVHTSIFDPANWSAGR
ncbi:MAG: YidC/Oxa1 family membrane protein insertase [Spirochaetaceae bacterium]|jgi:YidC/Oxa1 family membrane protein insertase|nr:YidC/Oxa1 family membrane protein insertase [Spirochaetaceae bacterium]